MTNVRIGTAYFVSYMDAVNYFRAQYDNRNQAAFAVVSKAAAGEIYIGKPPVRPGEKLIRIDNGTRYAIEW